MSVRRFVGYDERSGRREEPGAGGTAPNLTGPGRRAIPVWRTGVSLCKRSGQRLATSRAVSHIPGVPDLTSPAAARAIVLALLLGCAPASAPDRRPAPTPARAPVAHEALTARLKGRILEVPGARVAVAYRDLGGPDSLFILADSVFHAASTMKVPVMVELFRQVDAGRLSLDSQLPLRNSFSSIVDGSTYALDAGEDSDSSLYARVGGTVSVRELLERMITRSSNLATNVVIELVDAAAVRRTSAALVAADMRVLRGVEDGKAYAAGLNNTTTARSLAALMAAIEQGRAGSPAATAAMRQILLRQEFNDEIPAGLPPGTPVAHKTGSITATRHDAAVVYPTDAPPYVLVVLTGAIPDPAVARRLMRDLSRLVYADHVRRHALR
jgi:beta-lactamase class A